MGAIPLERMSVSPQVQILRGSYRYGTGTVHDWIRDVPLGKEWTTGCGRHTASAIDVIAQPRTRTACGGCARSHARDLARTRETHPGWVKA